jgi:hypothetical protein
MYAEISNIEFKIPVFLFIDLKKAFDSISLDGILNMTVKINLPRNIFSSIKEIYSKIQTLIETGSNKSRAISIGKGPILIMDEMISEIILEVRRDVKIGNMEFKIINLTDDTVLLAQRKIIYRLLYKFKLTAAKYNT